MKLKGWYFAGTWSGEPAKKMWKQVYHLEGFYQNHGEPGPKDDASHIAERHLKGEQQESVAPAWWNGKCFTLIMWRDKHGKLRKSRRRDHIKAFLKPAEGGSELEIRTV